jgi:energy-coupling factor transporter ATP-binding protein EcfA2
MLAAATEALIGGLLCRTGDAEIATCLENLVSQGFCSGADTVETRTITWEQSKQTPNWNGAPALAWRGETSLRQWGNVYGSLYRERPLFRIADDAGCWIAAPDRVCVFGLPAPSNPQWMELLAIVVFELLAAAGTVALHAGAVTVGGHGTLIVGPSGSGKSTLAYLVAQAGGSYTTDDLALISRRGGAWFARSTGEYLRLHPVMKIDDALMLKDGLDAAGKLRLHPHRPGVCVPVTRVEQLVFLDPNHGAQTTWRRLSGRNVVEGLLSEAALALTPAVAGQQLVSLRELSRLPAVTLQSGEDLMGQPDRGTSVFGEMWAGSPSCA